MKKEKEIESEKDGRFLCQTKASTLNKAILDIF